MTQEDQLRMIYDSANSVNCIKKGDNVYPTHDEELYVDQTTASKAIKVNPFAVTIYNGNIQLSPASDEWRDVERLPDKIIPGGTLISRRPAYLYNNHIFDWCGSTGTNALNRVVTNEAILNLVEDRVIESVLSHFMRARKVYFKATGLRPTTRVFTFLDGNNISSLTNGAGGEGSFQFYSDTDSDFGNTLKNTTIHPDGASTLVTDANGTISGSFVVPNNDTTKIRTGTREFKILDISVDKEQDAATVTSTPYTASGFIDTKQAEYTSTRIIHRPYYGYTPDFGDNDYGGGGAGGYTVYQVGNGTWNSKGIYTVDANGKVTDLGMKNTFVDDTAYGGIGNYNHYSNIATFEGIGGKHETYNIGTDLANDNSDDHDNNHSNPSDPSHSDPSGDTYT